MSGATNRLRRDAKMDAEGHCTVCGCEVRVYEGGEDNGLTNSELMRRHVCPPGFRQAANELMMSDTRPTPPNADVPTSVSADNGENVGEERGACSLPRRNTQVERKP
jgi:hypothetical protein